MSHKGFSLIELMTVVAIVAILAAIALPQYQAYAIGSQVRRAMDEASALKLVVEDCITQARLTLGSGPGECDPPISGSDILQGDSQGSIALPASVGVPQVSSPIAPTGSTTVVATFGHHAHMGIAGKKLTWTRDGNGTWQCATDVAAKYAPAGCPGI